MLYVVFHFCCGIPLLLWCSTAGALEVALAPVTTICAALSCFQRRCHHRCPVPKNGIPFRFRVRIFSTSDLGDQPSSEKRNSVPFFVSVYFFTSDLGDRPSSEKGIPFRFSCPFFFHLCIFCVHILCWLATGCACTAISAQAPVTPICALP